MPEYLSVFKNEKKSNPKAPDYRIMADVNGVFTELYVGWIKESKGGTKYISFSRSKPRETAPSSADMAKDAPF